MPGRQCLASDARRRRPKGVDAQRNVEREFLEEKSLLRTLASAKSVSQSSCLLQSLFVEPSATN